MAVITDEFEIPSVIGSTDEDEIHEEMLEILPDDLDKSEGQFPWDMTRPTAYILSQVRGYDLPEALQLAWPRYANGIYLDYHAETRNMVRKAATYATGTLLITGTEGTVIPAGSLFSTETVNNVASEDFATDEEVTIGVGGTVSATATAVTSGSDGNAAANTIIVKSNDIDDITAVTNISAFTGGVDEEEDEALKDRIMNYDLSSGESNVGNDADYKRWAEEVSGTGEASVIPAQDDSGLITIILMDGNGDPASQELCTSVYNHIMSPDDRSQRLAPINNVTLTVSAPTTVTITISATVELVNDTDVATVKAALITALKTYYQTAISDGEIRYQKVANILGDIDGVYDFSSLLLNNDTSNISLLDSNLPLTSDSDITLTEETV